MTSSNNFEKFGKGKKNNYEFSEWEDRKPSKKKNKPKRGGKDKYYNDGEQ